MKCPGPVIHRVVHAIVHAFGSIVANLVLMSMDVYPVSSLSLPLLTLIFYSMLHLTLSLLRVEDNIVTLARRAVILRVGCPNYKVKTKFSQLLRQAAVEFQRMMVLRSHVVQCWRFCSLSPEFSLVVH